MCGIAGFVTSAFGPEQAGAVAESMGRSLAHRGPDDHGLWHDSAGVWLVHRRLAILDLSPLGRQPMVSGDGRYVLVLNGEIYNYKEIRGDLQKGGIAFRGESDTEVLLEAVAKWGVSEALKRIKGMFAFALWDRAVRKLYLARDRVGEKPLYYSVFKGQLVFGSELKALLKFPGLERTLDLKALAGFFKYNYIPAPLSIFSGVYKLPPAHLAEYDATKGELEIQRYWSYPEPLTEDQESRFQRSEKDVVSEFHGLLKKSVSQELHADVPLGSFLSGGLDSSLVTAIMQELCAQPVRTFTIGFNEKAFDESEYAKAVAQYLGCQHTEWIVSPDQAKELIPKVPLIYDEPFSDSSQLPTCMLAQMTSREVKVALSGDGGDELFGGYYRYQWMERIWRVLSRIPLSARRVLGQCIPVISEEAWQSIYQTSFFWCPQNRRVDAFGHKIHKVARLLGAGSSGEAYDLIKSHWYRPELILGKTVGLDRSPALPEGRGLISSMMWLDSQTYLPDDIMVKVDRATMAVGLESRAPFLDHELIEYMSQVPLGLKVRGSRSKILMRSVLKEYLPTNLIDRPKKGFSVPMDLWLRTSLKEWAGDLLSGEALSHGLLNVEQVQRRWREHREHKRNWGLHLWDVLVFQMWYQAWIKEKSI